ncbi:MAG: hypothetical protein MUF14_02595 [Hyphomonadaceae bacterium]|nr:hypothetical protein [Hyphomonadaceae bacterium]
MAGSSLRDVFGANPHEVLQNPDCPSALPAFAAAFATGHPQAGRCEQMGGRNTGVRFWLRLPLGAEGQVEAVLGLDVALVGRRAPQWALEQLPVTA